MGKRMEKKRQELINNNKREYLDLTHKLHENTIPTNEDTSEKHEHLQYLAGSRLKRNGFEYLCNAYLKSGQIADLFVTNMLEPFIVEIAVSESQKSINFKNKTYPCKIIWIFCEDDIKRLI